MRTNSWEAFYWKTGPELWRRGFLGLWRTSRGPSRWLPTTGCGSWCELQRVIVILNSNRIWYSFQSCSISSWSFSHDKHMAFYKAFSWCFLLKEQSSLCNAFPVALGHSPSWSLHRPKPRLRSWCQWREWAWHPAIQSIRCDNETLESVMAVIVLDATWNIESILRAEIEMQLDLNQGPSSSSRSRGVGGNLSSHWLGMQIYSWQLHATDRLCM